MKYGKPSSVTALILILASMALAQGPPPSNPTQITTSRLWVTPASPMPQQVANASVQVSGSSGLATFFYWIVSKYTVGNSMPAGPFVITNAPNTLSVSNFDVVRWSPVVDAGVTYDVLRTSTPTMPSGTCGCAVATAVSGTSTNDQSASLSAYTVTTFDPNTLNLTLDNEVQGLASSHLILKQNGVQICDISTGCGGSSPLTTKGDLFTFSTMNARLPVGADASCLTADSTQILGLRWGTCGSPPAVPVGSVQYNNSGVPGGIASVAAGSNYVSAGALLPPITQQKPMIDVRDTPGVDCTGAADSSTALNSLFTGISGKHVIFPATCQIKVTSQLTIQGQTAFVIDGLGNLPQNLGASIFGCAGAAGPVLYINRSSYFRITGLNIQTTGSCASSFTQSMQIDNTGGGGFTPTEMLIDKMTIAVCWTGCPLVTNYIGINMTVAPNGENLKIRDSYFNCGDSLNSEAMALIGAQADNPDIYHNRVANCFQGIHADGPGARIHQNWFSVVGNFSIFGANGAVIWQGSCSSPPVTIAENEESDGGPFLNQGNDTGTGCSQVNVRDNTIGAGDYSTTAFLINVGNVSGSANFVTGNKIQADGTTSTVSVIGTAFPTFGSLHLGLGTLIELNNTLSGTSTHVGQFSGLLPTLPWGGGLFHIKTPGTGGGGNTPGFAIGGLIQSNIDTLFSPRAPFKTGGGATVAGVRSASISFSNNFAGGGGDGDIYTLANVPNAQSDTNSTLVLAHPPNPTATGVLSVTTAFAGALGVTAIAALNITNDSVVNGGASGATTWSYALVGVGGNSCLTAVSSSFTNTIGVATLTTTNFNQLLILANDPGVAYYKIYRTAAGGTPNTTGFIGTVQTTDDNTNGQIVFNDTGLTGDGSTPPATTTCTGGASFAGQIATTVATGTPPLSVASTTNVPNLNASSLNGATFAAPGPIGGTTPSTGAFTTVSTTGPVTTYNNIATAGLGLDPQVGVARLVSQTTNLGPTTLFTVGANTSQYLVTGTVYCDTSVATATVQLSIAYTDPSNTAQTISSGTATCTTLGSASLALVNTVVAAKNATAITYSTTVANAPNYDVRVEVYQLSAN